jgi:ABC-2 type transport system permease protein
MIGRIAAVTERELKSYFVSPVAYVVIAFFLLLAGYLFSGILMQTREATLRYLLSNISVLFLFITPILTMRLLAEENKNGTIELLLTNPIRDSEVVLGKYLAVVAILVVMLGLTLYYPAILYLMGGRPDQGPMLTGYLGVILLGAGCLALGLFASSLTQNQIVAAVVTFALLIVLWLSDVIQSLAGGVVSDVAGYLSVNNHFQEFSRGVLDTKDVVYFVTLILAGLFLTMLSVQSRRWR